MIFKLLISGLLFPTVMASSAYAAEKWPKGYIDSDEAYNVAESEQKTWVLETLVGINEATELRTLRLLTVEDRLTKNIISVGIESCGKYKFSDRKLKFIFRSVKLQDRCQAASYLSDGINLEVYAARSSFIKVLNQYRVDISNPLIDWENGFLSLVAEDGSRVATFTVEAAE